MSGSVASPSTVAAFGLTVAAVCGRCSRFCLSPADSRNICLMIPARSPVNRKNKIMRTANLASPDSMLQRRMPWPKRDDVVNDEFVMRRFVVGQPRYSLSYDGLAVLSSSGPTASRIENRLGRTAIMFYYNN